MRTKALIGLAVLAAGAATTMAQNNVYSLNVVGYYNLTMKPGYNLVANQLNTGTNGLNQVLPTAPADTMVLKYKNLDYVSDLSLGPGQWVDALTGADSKTTVAPGEGFFYYNPNSTDLQVTFVGEVVPSGTTTVKIAANGYSLVSSTVPQAIELTSANGFVQVPDMMYMTFNAAKQDYDTSLLTIDGPAWVNSLTGDPAVAAPQVGQGFFIYNPDATAHDWVRNFTIQ